MFFGKCFNHFELMDHLLDHRDTYSHCVDWLHLRYKIVSMIAVMASTFQLTRHHTNGLGLGSEMLVQSRIEFVILLDG